MNFSYPKKFHFIDVADEGFGLMALRTTPERENSQDMNSTVGELQKEVETSDSRVEAPNITRDSQVFRRLIKDKNETSQMTSTQQNGENAFTEPKNMSILLPKHLDEVVGVAQEPGETNAEKIAESQLDPNVHSIVDNSATSQKNSQTSGVSRRLMSLNEALENVALPDKTVMLMTFSLGFKKILRMWLQRMHKGQGTEPYIQHFLVITWDSESLEACWSFNLTCYLDSKEGTEGSARKFKWSKKYISYGTKNYYAMVFRKVELIEIILRKGFNVLFSDADVMWLKDPFPYLQGPADVMVSTDWYTYDPNFKGIRANTGFLFLRSNRRTKDFVHYWHDNHDVRFPDMHDQEVFDLICPHLDPHVGKTIGLSMHFLDIRAMGTLCKLQNDTLWELVTLHGACEVDKKSKIYRLKHTLKLYDKAVSSLPQLPSNNTKFSDDIATILEKATKRGSALRTIPKNMIVLLTLTTQNWMPILGAWKKQLETDHVLRKYLKRTVILTFDLVAYVNCTSSKLLCLYDNQIDPQTGLSRFRGPELHSNDKKFMFMMWRMWDVVQQILDLGYDVLYTHLDTIWLQEPYRYFGAKTDTDIFGPHICPSFRDGTVLPAQHVGIMYFRSNNGTRHSLRNWRLQNEQQDGNSTDMEALFHINLGIESKRGNESLRISCLPGDLFKNACESLQKKSNESLVFLHLTCDGDLGQKRKLMDLSRLFKNDNAIVE